MTDEWHAVTRTSSYENGSACDAYTDNRQRVSRELGVNMAYRHAPIAGAGSSGRLTGADPSMGHGTSFFLDTADAVSISWRSSTGTNDAYNATDAYTSTDAYDEITYSRATTPNVTL